jgi:cytochrome bd-type quinol oxidase subunit 1
VSPSVTTTDIWISLTVFVLLYVALGVADAYLMIHYGRRDLEADSDDGGDDDGSPPDETQSDEADSARVPALIY